MFILGGTTMVMVSTRGNDKCSLSDAILKGLASDGGLFVPEEFPHCDNFYTPVYDYLWRDLIYGEVDRKNPTEVSYEKPDAKSIIMMQKLAKIALRGFFKGDELEDKLDYIIENTFNFPVRLTYKNFRNEYLELFHGPTAAFKDFGARFLAYSMESILEKRGGELTILVATSGDTGSAVASAFYKRKGIKVKILFPKGGVSPRQKKLLTVWGENIESYEVDGTFDDCQRMVKEAFSNQELKKKYNLTSANSINIGRLLPQMIYYIYASVVHLYISSLEHRPIIVVPTGNLGNATAALYAKKIGAYISRVEIAQNANRPVVDYIETGKYTPRKSIRTYANAMDVGAPSNIERIFDLEKRDGSAESASIFGKKPCSVSDEEILETIKNVYEKEKTLLCPHSATAEYTYEYRKTNAIYEDWVIVCTAHPGKFETVVEKATGVKPDLPESLQKLLEKKEIYKNIGTDYMELFK